MNMKVLSRLVMIVMLLGGLAYGSYTFGKYVLSTRLFGTSVSPVKGSNFALNSSSRVDRTVTRRTTLKGQSRVELEVLPAQEAGPGPEPPSISNLERETDGKNHAATAPPKTRVITPQNFRAPKAYARDDSSSSSSSSSGLLRDDNRDNNRDNNRDENRPRRRRRRRRSDSSRSQSTTVRAQSVETPSVPADVAPDTSSSDNGGNSQSGASSDSSSGGSNASTSADTTTSEPRRSRRRERARDSSSEGSSTRRERTRTEAPRRRERSESPVPRPEGGGSSGGESPVPQPE